MPSKPRVFARDWKRPTSFGLWGGSAGDRCRLAVALAHRIDAEPVWLQIENPGQTDDAVELSIVQQVPPNRLYFVHPSELGPEDDLGNLASWFVREDVEANTRLRTLADFMRLPSLARRILEGRSAYSPTLALVVANSDRIQSLYPTEEGGIRPFLEALNEYAATPLFTLTTPPLPNSRDVDYLLQIEGDGSARHAPARVTCTHGAPPATVGLFTAGQRWGLADLIDQLEHPRPEG
jgi:hypothetical protein